MENNPSNPATESLADKISRWALLLTVFLAPLFFVPSALTSFQFTKIIVLAAGVIVALGAFVTGRLQEGRLDVPWHPVFIALVSLPITFGLAAIFSPVKTVSFVGKGYEVGTFSFIALAAVFVFLVSYLFREKKIVLYSYAAILASFAIVFIFQSVRLFAGPQFMSFGVLTSAVATMIGGWNDFGIYLALMALFSFISIEFLELKGALRTVLIAILALSVLFLSVVNYLFIWYVLGAFALVIFIHKFSFGSSRRFPVASLAVAIVCFIFILIGGNNIYVTLSNSPYNLRFLNRLNVSNVEVRPSWASTLAVGKDVFKTRPIFGVGPNRFANQWQISKPDNVNATQFWSVDFDYGVSLIPTYIIMTGALGALAWLAFLFLYVWMGIKILFAKIENHFENYVTFSSFSLSLFLWVVSLFYVPSVVILILTFFFTGLFLSSAVAHGHLKTKKVHLLKEPNQRFVLVVVSIIILFSVLGAGYGMTRRYMSTIYFNQGVTAFNIRNDKDQAESSINTAVQLSPNDAYYRTLVELKLARMNDLLSDKNIPPDPADQAQLRSRFQTYLGDAESLAKLAIDHDVTNYQNWMMLGRVYVTVVPLGVKDSYENALGAYKKAAEFNPTSPAIPLALAGLEVAASNNGEDKESLAKAKQHIADAQKLKSDYTDALILLSQIQLAEKDSAGAIRSVQSAAAASPNDPTISYQFGILLYNDKQYAEAASVLQNAVNLAPNYANAKYFLGLSYAELDRSDEAIKVFEDLKATNPDSAELDLILDNLRAGKDPLSNGS